MGDRIIIKLQQDGGEIHNVIIGAAEVLLLMSGNEIRINGETHSVTERIVTLNMQKSIVGIGDSNYGMVDLFLQTEKSK